MWLKVHYPFESYAVILTLDSDEAPDAVREAKHFGVTIDKPDVNVSKAGFTVDWGARAIRFGLMAIDGIGDGAASQVIENAPYESVEHFDFANSFKYSKCNRGHRLALLEAGALDSIGGRADWTDAQRAATELRRLGMALRPGGTFGDAEEFVLEHTHSRAEFEEMPEKERVVVAGRVMEHRLVTIKSGYNKGKQMAHARIGVGLDVFDLTLFYRPFAEFGELLKQDQGVIVVGRKDASEKILVDSMMHIGDWLEEARAGKLDTSGRRT
jgi:DNA polymerase III alpha subunit